MSIHEQDLIFSALQIRDTGPKVSSISDLKGFDPKSILIKNDLNQAVTITCEGSDDVAFTNVWSIGGGDLISANSNEYLTLGDYFPYLRCKAICSTAPTTGSIDCWVMKRT